MKSKTEDMFFQSSKPKKASVENLNIALYCEFAGLKRINTIYSKIQAITEF